MTKKHNLNKDIIAKKSYSYVNSDITSKNFPVPEKIETENWKLIRMDKSFSSKEALERIKKEGCRPANIYELAIFTNEHSEEFPKGKWTGVIAFGSEYTDSGGDHRVPSVRARGDGDFEFDLGFFEDVWGSDYCLLCFCDSSSDTQALSTDQPSDSLTLERAIQVCKDNGLVVYQPK